MNNTDRLPPNDAAAERALIGSLLRDNQIIPEVAMTTTAEHFYVFAHQRIYAVIIALNNDGKPADLLTVANKLRAESQVEECGGIPYLAELWDAAPSAGHFRQYAEIIKSAWQRREIIHASNNAIESAFDLGTESATVVDRKSVV